MDIGKPFKSYMDYKQELGLLYILKEYQRKGIGKMFMSIAYETVKMNGYNEFFVSCNSQNVNGRRFYEANGGKIINRNDVKSTPNNDVKLLFVLANERSSNKL